MRKSGRHLPNPRSKHASPILVPRRFGDRPTTSASSLPMKSRNGRKWSSSPASSRNDPAGAFGTLLQDSETAFSSRQDTLLAVAGGIVAAARLSASGFSSSKAATDGPRTSRCIDAHTHYSSLRYLDALEKQEGRPFVLGANYRRRTALTDAKARLDLLDRNEVDIHILVPVPWLEAFPRVVNDRTAAPQLARLMNDEIAEVVAKEPKRFRGVAVLP